MREAQGRKAWSGILRWAWLVVILLVLVVLVFSTWRSRRGSGRQDGAWQRIQEEGVLRVGMDASYPPFEWIDERGEFVGYDVDLARELARRWGVEPQFVNVHFDGLYDALEAEKVDLLISALPHDRAMTQDVVYSEPYFNAGQVLVVARGDTSMRSVEDLDGRCVGVELGARSHQWVRQLARDQGLSVEIVTGRHPENVFAFLEEGSADAVICDRVTAYGYMKGRALRIVDPPLTNAPFVMAGRADSRLLMKKVDEALGAWREVGFLADLEERWLR
ncbi:MAG: ABC transporter substrate-binding protein [Chloroflexota bacterium]|nr:ABC transporter substrate-binding protein [Chloroflexota bacterium]